MDVLRATGRAIRRATAANLESRPVFKGSRDLEDYLRVHLAFETTEHVRALYLDAANRLIRDELAGRGTPSEAPLYVRSIIAQALRLDASSVFIAHNHPSGAWEPSENDLSTTDHLLSAARSLGIEVLDHVIVTRRGSRSLMEALRRRGPGATVPAAARGVSDHETGAGIVDGPSAMVGATAVGRRAGSSDHAAISDVTRIRGYLKFRRRRDALFGERLFSDPAWDMLLDLYAADMECSCVAVGSLCVASAVPISTALRWIAKLESRGLVLRSLDRLDRRRSLVRMTDDGRAKMADLIRLAECRSALLHS